MADKFKTEDDSIETRRELPRHIYILTQAPELAVKIKQ